MRTLSVERWEWYLDRLAAAVAGDAPPTLGDFDRRYLPQAVTYIDSLTS